MYSQITPIGDNDYFRVDVPMAGMDLRVEVVGTVSLACPTGDTYLTLRDAAGAQLGVNDDGGDGLCPLINPGVDAFAQNLAAGTYYIQFNELGNNATTPQYRLLIDLLP